MNHIHLFLNSTKDLGRITIEIHQEKAEGTGNTKDLEDHTPIFFLIENLKWLSHGILNNLYFQLIPASAARKLILTGIGYWSIFDNQYRSIFDTDTVTSWFQIIASFLSFHMIMKKGQGLSKCDTAVLIYQYVKVSPIRPGKVLRETCIPSFIILFCFFHLSFLRFFLSFLLYWFKV